MTLWRLRESTAPTLASASGNDWSLTAEVATGASGAWRLLGGLTVRTAVGLDLPRYWYHVGTVVHAAEELGLFHRQRTLLLGNDLTGAAEILDIELDPGVTAGDEQASVLDFMISGALLLLARRRAVGGSSADFTPDVIVELPGLRDASGKSPFWSGLGRNFYSGEPPPSGTQGWRRWRSAVASLLPRDPLIASFLPDAARASIGEVAPTARALSDALRRAGLRRGSHVTIDDAGPVFEGQLDMLPAAATARRLTIVADSHADPEPWLLAIDGPGNGELTVIRAATPCDGTTCALDPQARRALGVDGRGVVWGCRISE